MKQELNEQGISTLQAHIIGQYFSCWGQNSDYLEAAELFEQIINSKANALDLDDFLESNFGDDAIHLGESFESFAYMQIEDFAELIQSDFIQLRDLILNSKQYIKEA